MSRQWQRLGRRLLAGYRQGISRVHLQGLKIIGATMTPFRDTAYYCDDGEATSIQMMVAIRPGQAQST